MLVDKKFKEDLDMDVIMETEDSNLSSARPRLPHKRQEEVTDAAYRNSIANVRPLDTDGSNSDHNAQQVADNQQRCRSITYDFYNLKSGGR